MHIVLSFLIAAVAIWIGIVLIPLTVKNDIYRLTFNAPSGGISGPIPLPLIGDGLPTASSGAAETGRLGGTVSLRCDGCDASEALKGRYLVATSAERGSSVTIPVASDGVFVATLPSGRYYVDLPRASGERAEPLPGYVFIEPDEDLPLDVTLELP